MGLAICESHHQFSVSLDGGANGLIQFPHLSTHPPTSTKLYKILVWCKPLQKKQVHRIFSQNLGWFAIPMYGASHHTAAPASLTARALCIYNCISQSPGSQILYDCQAPFVALQKSSDLL